MANLPTSIKNLNTLLGEQLTEGGGGGSSDFSTAEVTVDIVGTAVVPYCVMPFATDHIDPDYPEDNYSASEAGPMISGTFTVPLYKGECRLKMDSGHTVVGTGNVEIIEGIGRVIIITGDCTITIS